MERLLMIPDIMERYKCNERTARDYMREMGTVKTKPMMVRETAVDNWEKEREQASRGKYAAPRPEPKNTMVSFRTPIPKPKPGQWISRERPKKREA